MDPMQMIDAPASRCGNAVSTVLITPTRSTETASRKATGGIPGVAIGYGTESICEHTSTAMMSAPSCASLTAWLRP
jgi:hypothetical protein